jgi:hypothetical protein
MKSWKAIRANFNFFGLNLNSLKLGTSGFDKSPQKTTFGHG